jgi:antitoxin component of MazEF toxin-antitoxin module
VKKVKLQKIGNSLRATIPKEIADELELENGQSLSVRTNHGAIILQKAEEERSISDMYGIIRTTKKVKKWPTPAEMKDIWH